MMRPDLARDRGRVQASRVVQEPEVAAVIGQGRCGDDEVHFLPLRGFARSNRDAWALSFGKSQILP
eukprot:8631129-Pyramimonas_sp.AAC.1